MGIQPLSRSQKASLERATTAYESQMDEVAWAYLDKRGLGEAIAPGIATSHRLGVVRSPLPGHEQFVGRLAIPFIGPNANVYDIRYRCIEDHECKEASCPKYLGTEGMTTRMFNTRALTSSTDYIFVCEGELDAITISACGWPAVGLPGANSWRPHHSRMLAGFSKVVVLCDGDASGRGLGLAVQKSLVSTCHIMVLPANEDVNSVWVREGKEGIKALLKQEDGSE